MRSASRTAQKGPFFQAMPLPVCVIAAGLPAFTRHTITSPDVLRQTLSVIKLTQIAISRNEFECGKAAIAMPIFYGAGRVAAAIELTVRDLGSELKPAASALSVASHSLSRQLATELRVRASRSGHTARVRSSRWTHTTEST